MKMRRQRTLTLNFEMSVEGENLSLRLKGEEGVKEFLKSELGM